MEKITVALAGNPNVGKTSVFNRLVGSRQRVGNWPGVTVEKLSGKKKYEGYEIEFVDLPGTYGLAAYSKDEIVARDYLINEKPDVVVHVIDATNLKRNLYLTTQILELGSKVVIALNMSDMAETRGDKIDVSRLSEFLGVPVVKTVASEDKGTQKLLETITEVSKTKQHIHEISYGSRIERKILSLEKVLGEDAELSKKIPLRWLSARLLEGDKNAIENVASSPAWPEVKKFLKGIDSEKYEAQMVDKRYSAISLFLPQVCTICAGKTTVSDMIDRVVTNKYLGIPIFLIIIWAAFELTFTLSTPFMEIVGTFFSDLSVFVLDAIPGLFGSLLGNGIIGGLGFVLVFVPPIFIMFLMLSVLEDSGYLSRAAFVMDRLMYKLGLQGKSFVPMLMGIGCNVPAIMATRTIDDEKDRFITILVTPFISCGARLPVFILLAGAFFGHEAGTVIFSLYVLGIVVAILSALLLRKFVFKGEAAPFIMELPIYRRPTFKTSFLHAWNLGFTYIKKAGPIIVIGAIIIWFLASFPEGVTYGGADSYVGVIGQTLEPIFAPLGFDWKMVVALIFGFVAKELVISALGVLYSNDETKGLSLSLQEDAAFTPLSSLSLMVFTLLYVPCIATLSVIKKETGSWKWMAFSATYSIGIAWIAAFLIYQGGLILGFS